MPAAVATGAPPAGPSPAGGAPLEERGTVRHDQLRATRWRLRGIGKVLRDVDVGAATIRGTLVVGGALRAATLATDGGLDARGGLAVQGRLTTRGSFEAGAGVRAADADLEGTVRVAQELAVDGLLRVQGSLRAEKVRCGRFVLRGSAHVAGTVEAGSVDARLLGDSTIGAVVAQDCRWKGPAPSPGPRLLASDALATIGRIDAETVVLERIRVGTVRAGHVVLGRAAHVGVVEGTVDRAHSSSRVGPESWSRPPDGLSR